MPGDLPDPSASRGPPDVALLCAGLWAAARACRRMTVAALFLTIAGWSLIWAEALGLVGLVPMWFAIGTFASGLALIPFMAERPPPGMRPGGH